MSLAFAVFKEKPRLRALLDHLSVIDDPRDPRDPRRVAYPLTEVLLLVVCGTMADCDDYDSIAAWGEVNLPFLRRYLPYHHGAPGGRWLTLLMNRINPALFSSAFTAWVRATWPERPDLVAIDGKTSRRSHDRAEDKAPLHLVSAFATTQRLVLGQEAVEGKTNELAAIPVLLEKPAEGGGLKGALVSIDAIATNAKIAQAIKDAGADYLLAVNANQPTLRSEIESLFAIADQTSRDDDLDHDLDHDKGHGRIERRAVRVVRDVDWLNGERRFPGELCLPHAATVIRVKSRAELSERCRFETRYYISSAALTAKQVAEAVRGHWRIESAPLAHARRSFAVMN
jgi:predicted transposase YbfD/YdcC